MPETLTPRRRAILRALWRRNGKAPTYRELARAAGYLHYATGSIEPELDRLSADGYLTRTAGRARTLRLTGKGLLAAQGLAAALHLRRWRHQDGGQPMSIKVMSTIWEGAEARGSELLILLALADFANDDGVSWPSVATLAAKARVSERQTHEVIGNLVARGLLTRQQNAGPNGVNVYTVISGVRISHPEADSRGVRKYTPGGVEQTAPKPSLEPSRRSTPHPSSHNRPRDEGVARRAAYG